jgi:hypothetical protein
VCDAQGWYLGFLVEASAAAPTFLVGAALMLPAWRAAVRSRGARPAK